MLPATSVSNIVMARIALAAIIALIPNPRVYLGQVFASQALRLTKAVECQANSFTLPSTMQGLKWDRALPKGGYWSRSLCSTKNLGSISKLQQ
jgi:hypothetical protein